MAHSIEEPGYQVVESIDAIEIRVYAPVVQAVTSLPDSAESSAGFRRLAGYIFGGNDQEQKIAMTAPVQETLGVETPEMAFTMPVEYTLDDLPTPADGRVSLRIEPAKTVAVVRFSGWATSSRVSHYEQELRAVLNNNSIQVVGEASLNQYNPPWTLPFLRRNEIMIEVASSS
ncbi:MAG: heme-binding protein [Halioglobus sp.]